MSVFKVRVKGPMACFTQPEFKTNAVSYDIITPSAARGIIEAILWKPAIRWFINQIDVLCPIERMSYMYNGINKKFSERGLVVDANKDRIQRNNNILINVEYIIHCYFKMTNKAGEEDNISKFEDMFKRRCLKHEVFRLPYFGCKKFLLSDYELLNNDFKINPINLTEDLGRMFYDFDYKNNKFPIFFNAKLINGSMIIPHINGDK